MDLHRSIGDYLLSGQLAGLSPATLRAYRWHLDRWATWLELRGLRDPAAIARADLRAWAAGLAEHWQPATCKQAVCAVKAFLVWWVADTDGDPAILRALHTPKQPRHVQRTVTTAEIDALLTACHGLVSNVAPAMAMAMGARNAAIVALLFDGLLRATELCAVVLGDLDLAHCRLLVRVSKTARPRLVPFSPLTAGLLAAWLALRPEGGAATVFVSLGGNTPGQPLTPRGLRIILRNLARRAGVPPLSPHAFRRGGACALALNGAPDRLIETWAGWSSNAMLHVYTRALQESQAADRFAAYSALAGLDPNR